MEVVALRLCVIVAHHGGKLSSGNRRCRRAFERLFRARICFAALFCSASKSYQVNYNKNM